MRATSLTAMVSLVLVLALAPTAGAEPDELGPCGTPADHPGGDWPSYGHDLANSRSQPLETEIGPDTVADLEVAWVFDTSGNGGGSFNNTPVVANGCVFLAADSGGVHALDADTGDLIWTTELPVSPSGFGGGIVGSPAVWEDLLLVIVNRRGSPYVAALDQATGDEVWNTIIDPEGFTNASVVVVGDLVFAGHSGNREYDSTSQGGFVILDAEEGEILAKTPTIPDEDFWEHDYRGAGIWSTAAVDAEAGYAYVGTSNPHSPSRQHHRTNSILKIDLDPEREDTFGEIVGSYRGLSEQYVDGLDRQPACAMFGEDITYPYGSVPCLELDIDFGASPNLFTDERGNQVVGTLQKAGVYHAVYTDTMARGWTATLGGPCFACNAASAAFDGERILGASVPPGQAWALDKDTGAPEWLMPLADGLHYFSVSHANGVAYMLDTYGFLNAFDAETGLPLAKRLLTQDVGTLTVGGLGSSGVAIARNTVYAAVSSRLVAYRP